MAFNVLITDTYATVTSNGLISSIGLLSETNGFSKQHTSHYGVNIYKGEWASRFSKQYY